MIIFLSLALAAEPAEIDDSPWVDQSFVIVASEKSFDNALEKAGRISVQAGVPFDMQNVRFDPAHLSTHGGLTHSEETCVEFGEYPCYIPRGRWDAGIYLSVEYSSAIQGFTPGLYVVIAATGTKEEMQPVLTTVQKAAPDAYLKTSSVYMGCLH